jgi:RimK family alpha-L-glutamate ligase
MKNNVKNKLGWIIYPKSTLKNQTNAFDWLANEARKFNIDIKILFIEDFSICSGNNNFVLYQNKNLELPDFIIMRGYEFMLSNHFETIGIPVINTYQSMFLSLNKMLTHQILTSKNIKTPKTIFNFNHEYNYVNLADFFQNNKFIVKAIDGSKGENVYLVNNQTELETAVKNCNNNCIVQQFIETSFGKDIRAWVIGNKVVASVLRYSETSFISNFSQGGKVAVFEMTKEIENLAVFSAKSLGLEFAGVDILFDNNGYTVCEINGNAGFRSISSISNENIPYKLFEYIDSKY